ncbi:U1 small nuclear ribonucleoprotein 70 kDa-like [Prorops nasuta]|uniref:U1 small nuclear ribonucleoprotein 70 kDa-like n=1 Tax=Prorops nasuta TaxID=863751 RepID=UPI0034CF6C15
MGKLGGGGRGEIAEDEAVQTGDFERSERGDFERSERGDFERSERGDFERSERGDFERSERGDFERSETGDFERAETEEGGSVQVGDFDGRERKVIADKHPQALFDRVRVEEYEQMQGRETRTNEGGEDEEGDAAGIGGGDYIIQLTKLQQDATSESAIYRKDRSLANTYFKLYMCSGRNGTSYFSKGNSWIH